MVIAGALLPHPAANRIAKHSAAGTIQDRAAGTRLLEIERAWARLQIRGASAAAG